MTDFTIPGYTPRPGYLLHAVHPASGSVQLEIAYQPSAYRGPTLDTPEGWLPHGWAVRWAMVPLLGYATVDGYRDREGLVTSPVIPMSSSDPTPITVHELEDMLDLYEYVDRDRRLENPEQDARNLVMRIRKAISDTLSSGAEGNYDPHTLLFEWTIDYRTAPMEAVMKELRYHVPLYDPDYKQLRVSYLVLDHQDFDRSESLPNFEVEWCNG